MAPNTNTALLTRSHKVAAAKRHAKKQQIKEIMFDDEARREFLTGFHKRKLEKKEKAKQKALEREKQDRLESRREQRRMLAERAAQNAKEVEAAYGAVVDEDEGEAEGENEDNQEEEQEREYSDEENLATVTVVEDFDPQSLIYGDRQHSSSDQESQHDGTAPEELEGNDEQTASHTKLPKAKKEKPVKYQTSAARKHERAKQLVRKKEKAERAGGKSRVKSKANHKKGKVGKRRR